MTLERCAPGALGRGLVRWDQGGLEASWNLQCACDYEVLVPAVFIFLILEGTLKRFSRLCRRLLK